MDERVAERLRDRHVAHDTRLLGDFVDIYCGGQHADRPRVRLQSDGAEFGVYRRRVPALCEECAEFMCYAEKRRAFCPKDPKPFCATCETHCYKADMREYSRVVMRYSGPKSWRRGYLVDGIKHALQMRRARKIQATRAAATADDQKESQ